MKPLYALFLLLILFRSFSFAQQTPERPTNIAAANPVVVDTPLRIKNVNPYFTLHVDSTLRYQFEINKDMSHYYWFLKNAPVGLKINQSTGLLSFKAEKSYFLSGRLKYDKEYPVDVTVQNLDNPNDRVDTSFHILFFSTEIIPSKLKPSVTSNLFMDEGDTISFNIQCEQGSYPIETISYISDYSIKSTTPVNKCGDVFTWYAPFDFVKPTDKDKQKAVTLYFIGATKFHNNDTARINIFVRENINYPQQVGEFNRAKTDVSNYVEQLKSSFFVVDRKIKHTKNTRTGFDLASAGTALSGTVLTSMPDTKDATTGKILPSVGVALVPVKEAAAPNNNYDQNMATQIRSTIKRLEYLLSDVHLIGDRDPDVITKTKRLRDELNQAQVQLIDIPLADANTTQKQADDYYNNPKVQKKYKLRKDAKN